jgi:hypothetical protein
MKVAWCRRDEYTDLYEAAEPAKFHTSGIVEESPIDTARGIVYGVLMGAGFWLIVLAIWFHKTWSRLF